MMSVSECIKCICTYVSTCYEIMYVVYNRMSKNSLIKDLLFIYEYGVCMYNVYMSFPQMRHCNIMYVCMYVLNNLTRKTFKIIVKGRKGGNPFTNFRMILPVWSPLSLLIQISTDIPLFLWSSLTIGTLAFVIALNPQHECKHINKKN